MSSPGTFDGHPPLSSERRALLEQLIRGTRAGASHAITAPSRSPRSAPASHAQRRLWFLDQVQQEHAPYTLYGVLPLSWPVDPVTLERAVNEIVARHEVLRTTFATEEGEPVQRIHASLHVPLDVQDLRALPAAARQAEATRRIARVLGRRMDLERGPLLATALYRLDEQQWLFLLTIHHIVFDGPSFPIFFDELTRLYEAFARGGAATLAARTRQYADFTNAQRAALVPERVAAEVAFWRGELANLPILDLPLDRPRPAAPTFRGAQQRVAIPADLVHQLQRLAVSQNTTLFTVLLAATAATLHHVCDQQDFALGLPVTGRDAPGMADALGFFVDTIVVRCVVDDELTVEALIARTRAALNRSLAHRLLPFEMLVEHLSPARDLGLNPFFQVGFQLTQHPRDASQPNAIEVPRGGAMFDLGFDLWTERDAVIGRLEFNTDVFDDSTIDHIRARFEAVLRAIVEPERRVSDLEIGVERTQDLAILHGESVALGRGSVGHVFDEIATVTPTLVALSGWHAGTNREVSLTYPETLAHARRLARALRRQGVVPGAHVALALPRSIELACLSLACWLCDAAFIPIDPAWPASRIADLMADAQPVVTVDAALAAALWQEEERRAQGRGRGGGHDGASFANWRGRDGGHGGGPPLASSAWDPVWPVGTSTAYIIFTSGSTGTPKGVVLEHVGLLNVALAQRKAFGLGPGRRVAQLASPTFDASIFEMTLALAAGATLVIAPAAPLVGAELAAFLRDRAVDTIVIPPSLLATLSPDECPQLRTVLVAGESCPAALAARWEQGRDFWNLYGPTETTIWATCGRGSAGARVPIGQPIANTTTIVVDRTGQPVEIGRAGELCVAGIGVSRGYLNRAELTERRFGTHPAVPHARAYRTGDRVRQLRDGRLIFLGRIDRQLKVRGFRIEPEEIESILREQPFVSDVVVDGRAAGDSPHSDHGHGEHEQALVAYLLCGDTLPDLDACREAIARRLPQYMVPTHIIPVREFPRTSSGKIDRARLPAPDSMRRQHDFIAPSTATEQRVAELMARAARVSRVGASDNFFRIGGHSLAAAELVSRLRVLFAVDVGIRDVFAYPTVAQLASRIDALARELAQVGADAEPEVPLVRLPRRHETA